MGFIKINIGKKDIFKEILGVISQPQIPRKIIFHCKENIPVLADNNAVKRVQKIAETNQREIEFICEKKFTRNIIQKFDFSVYEKCPDQYKKIESIELSQIYQKKSLPKKNASFGKTIKNYPKNENPDQTETAEENNIKKIFTSNKIHNPGRRKTARSKIFFLFLSIFLFLGAVFVWISPMASIKVKPTLYPIPVIQNVILHLANSEIDETEEELPKIRGIFVSNEVEGSESFTSSGRTYDIENAYGKVTLFNETNKPKFLVPSRLSTEDGLIFRFNKNVTIPAKTGDNPGKIVVDVVADKFDTNKNPIGFRGNIIAGTKLFFPALRKELQELYYAKANKGPLVGGSTLSHYIVQSEDEENSANLLTEILQTRAIEELKKENKQRSSREKKTYVILENKNLLLKNLQEFKFPKDLVGKEAETFEVSAKLEVSGIVFDQEEVKKILLKQLNSILDDRQELIELDKNSIEYNILDYENFAEKKYLKISAKAIGVKSLNFNLKTREALKWKEDLKKQIMGKTKEEAISILVNIPEIEQVTELKVSPFWSQKIPSILNRIFFESEKTIPSN